MTTTSKGRVRIGCAVWSWRDWVGGFLPRGTRSADMLRRYAERLPAVEGNTTFYGTPSADTVRRWRDEVPDDFRFAPKMPRTVTHEGALADGIPQAREFLSRIGELREKLGPVLLQLPPAFSPADLPDLDALLAAVRDDISELAVEVRHGAWFAREGAERLLERLERWRCARCVLDSRPVHEGPGRPLATANHPKPRLPLADDDAPGPTYVRWVAHPDVSLVGRWLRDWAPRLRARADRGEDAYVFAHCPDIGRQPELARRAWQCLHDEGVPLDPLPDPDPEPPAQLTLFD